jgi:hypothetical protein
MRAGIGVPSLVAVLAVAGCGKGDIGYAVRLEIAIDGSINDDQLHRIRTLEIQVAGSAEDWYQRLAVSGQLDGRSGEVVYRPKAGAGTLDFTLRVRDQADALIGEGRTEVILVPGATVQASVLIATPVPADLAMGDGGAGPDLIVIDLTPPPPPDMAMKQKPDLTTTAMDMATTPADMAMSVDAAMSPADLAGSD